MSINKICHPCGHRTHHREHTTSTHTMERWQDLAPSHSGLETVGCQFRSATAIGNPLAGVACISGIPTSMFGGRLKQLTPNHAPPSPQDVRLTRRPRFPEVRKNRPCALFIGRLGPTPPAWRAKCHLYYHDMARRCVVRCSLLARKDWILGRTLTSKAYLT